MAFLKNGRSGTLRMARDPVSLGLLIRGIAAFARAGQKHVQRDPMSKDSDQPAGGFDDGAEAWLGSFLAGEDGFDRNTLWRLGSWGVGAVAALTLGVMAGQYPADAQGSRMAAIDMATKTQRVATIAEESRLEARRLAAAVETLNTDRDRLYSRLSTIEQGLDSVTGSIGRQEAKAAPSVDAPKAGAAPDMPVSSVIPPVAIGREEQTATRPAERIPEAFEAVDPLIVHPAGAATTLAALMKDANPAAATATATEETADAAEVAVAVPRTEFGLDLGGANSVNGLRTLWRGLQSAHAAEFRELRPIVVVRERKAGLGVQLRLVAGPIRDVAAAEKICARLGSNQRGCETTIFDGQRLEMPKELPRARAARQQGRSEVPAKRSWAETSLMPAFLGGR